MRRVGRGLWLTAAVVAATACKSSPPAEPTPASPPPAAPVAPGPPIPRPAPPPPAAAVPPQKPLEAAPSERPYREILDLKNSGATDEALLERVLAGKRRYDLTTEEALELRKAGVSEEVVEAMLRSGR